MNKSQVDLKSSMKGYKDNMKKMVSNMKNTYMNWRQNFPKNSKRMGNTIKEIIF